MTHYCNRKMKLLEYSDSFLVLSMNSTDAMIYSRTYTLVRLFFPTSVLTLTIGFTYIPQNIIQPKCGSKNISFTIYSLVSR